ncbi:hypothetical protein BE20_00685 [Sorangium cellulosum]|nr:hypothetical protein BE20_00685 [Sorangium cellulosum]
MRGRHEAPFLDAQRPRHLDPGRIERASGARLRGELRRDPADGDEPMFLGDPGQHGGEHLREGRRSRGEGGADAELLIGHPGVRRLLLERRAPRPARLHDGRPSDPRLQRPEQPDRGGARGDEREGAIRPGDELVAQPLAQRPIRIQPDDVPQEALDVLVVLRPGALPVSAPGAHAIHVLGGALGRLGGLGRAPVGRELLDFLETRLDVPRVSQQDLVQLAQGGGRRLEQLLARLHGAEPVALQEGADPLADLLLLQVEPALAALDAGDEIAHGDLQRRHHVGVPCLGCRCAPRRAEHLDELGREDAREQGEALARERLIVEEEVDDRGREARQRVLARAHEAGPVHPRQEPLLAQALDGVGGALARVLGARVGDLADLLEDVDKQVLLEGRERRPLGTRAQGHEVTEVRGVELQRRAGALERGDQAVRVHGDRCGVRCRSRRGPGPEPGERASCSVSMRGCGRGSQAAPRIEGRCPGHSEGRLLPRFYVDVRGRTVNRGRLLMREIGRRSRNAAGTRVVPTGACSSACSARRRSVLQAFPRRSSVP